MNLNKEVSLLQLTANSIRNDNLEELDHYLRIMPLEKLPDGKDSILEKFLALASYLNRQDACNYILDRWKVLYPDNDKITIFTRLFLLSNNLTMLAYIFKIYPEFTYLELMDELCDCDASQECILACGKADDIFGIQPYDTYKLVQQRAIESGNFVVENYVIENLNLTAPTAPKPIWVRDFNLQVKLQPLQQNLPKITSLPSEKELYEFASTLPNQNTDLNMSDSDIINFLTQGLKDSGIEIVDNNEMETAKKIIAKELKNPKIRSELIAPLLENQNNTNLQNNQLLFKIFGPSNPMVGHSYPDDNISSKFGGARMFLFNLFDYDEEYDKIIDWFTGNCYQCKLKILQRWHAVRLPSPMGGWKNCYCSWECVEADLIETENSTDEKDILSHKLLNIFKEETLKIGIQDRI